MSNGLKNKNLHYIVVGAGPAGVTACETIRKLDQDAQISLVGAEPEPPYSRMAIPYLLSEKIQESGTYLRKDRDYYKQQGIDIIHDTVASIDSDANNLQLLGGGSLHFDKLLLATGATPINPPIPGIDCAGVHHCWTLDDARAIADRAHSGSSVVLMGAGFIGCIILESLVQRGVKLTIVERGDRMVPRMMDETAGRLLKEWCESKGVQVLTSHSLSAIESVAAIEEKGLLAVTLDSGEVLSADLVISATGVQANTGFLDNSGIETDQGVLVNPFMQTSREAIFAAGDVAQGRDFSTGEFSVQAIQPTAVEHGRIAAINMVHGNSLAHQGSLNMNILDTLGLISTSFGQWMGVEGGDEVTQLDEARFKYLNLQFKDDCLVGVSSLGHTENMGVARGLIRGQVHLGEWKKRLQANPVRLMEAYLACSIGAA